MNFLIPPLEIDLVAPDKFLVIRETLTRMGVATKDKVLYQSCHILHKRSRYYITHFKEMMALDGHTVNLTEYDIARRNRIAFLLQDFGLLRIFDVERHQDNVAPTSAISIIPFKQKHEWILQPKYTIGVKK